MYRLRSWEQTTYSFTKKPKKGSSVNWKKEKGENESWSQLKLFYKLDD